MRWRYRLLSPATERPPEIKRTYHATTLDPRFQNIVEMTHISTFVVKRIRKENNLLHMTLRTWWINYNDMGGRGYAVTPLKIFPVQTPYPAQPLTFQDIAGFGPALPYK